MRVSVSALSGGGGGHEQLAAAGAHGPAVAAHRVPVLVLRPGARVRTRPSAAHALAPAAAIRAPCTRAPHRVHIRASPRAYFNVICAFTVLVYKLSARYK